MFQFFSAKPGKLTAMWHIWLCLMKKSLQLEHLLSRRKQSALVDLHTAKTKRFKFLSSCVQQNLLKMVWILDVQGVCHIKEMSGKWEIYKGNPIIKIIIKCQGIIREIWSFLQCQGNLTLFIVIQERRKILKSSFFILVYIQVQVQFQVGLLQALLPFARHIEITNKSSPLLNSLYFLSSCGYEAELYRDRHTPTLLLYPLFSSLCHNLFYEIYMAKRSRIRDQRSKEYQSLNVSILL